MGSYTAIGAPMKVIIPGPRQKTPVELPKIKLHLNKQQNAMVRLPCSTVTNSQPRVSQQQVQKLKQLQQVNLAQPLCQQPQHQPVHLVNQPTQALVTQEPQLQPVHLTKQPTQALVTQEPQLQPLHLANQPTKANVDQEQEIHEPQCSSDQPVHQEKTVTFADVHYDQYGRCSPIHGGSDSGRSTPTQTNSGRSSPAQSIHGEQSTAILSNRRASSPTNSIQASQSSALIAYGRSSSPVKNVHGDKTLALMPQRRPSITQLVVYQPQQQIIPKAQGHKQRLPTNKRKASLTSPQPTNMQFSLVLPNQNQMMGIPKKQVEYQQSQAPQGYKAARKGSTSGQNIVIKIVIK